tara:strand:+ start:9052 stop:9366 length:315 start_codon:yes stop_codon:yes gene_type:complete
MEKIKQNEAIELLLENKITGVDFTSCLNCMRSAETILLIGDLFDKWSDNLYNIIERDICIGTDEDLNKLTHFLSRSQIRGAFALANCKQRAEALIGTFNKWTDE